MSSIHSFIAPFRCFSSLTNTNNPTNQRHPALQIRAAGELQAFVEFHARTVSSQHFTHSMNDLIRRIFDLVNSQSSDEKMGSFRSVPDHRTLHSTQSCFPSFPLVSFFLQAGFW